ncbi:hypothetical protein GPY51_23390 [Photorhabdus laumondii subsp. laumondii]|uniref:Photorhabdus luminescens subsp. laumondii TTO1 complete genome segment 11/17 n=3 Tax=Photorhabdus TaxID=29487 RepID=Q7N2D3_PHOLL|nr:MULTISPECIES: hypothetical protein [Photorhabdus]AWK42849.1 hypothetical protein A4R40_15740 [Photorhabdus laumondii subsp. laumondii]AXG43622.1 hypothetical protein PluDJC_16105 [Photorhabdus laumondii subsp. laumondii]AXG48165.1 hypothetical protein PluTT01m_16220 [Photorhabdus laumondii subsp. laumondii]EYU15255.1 hypothetical protein BA1DRAFT_02241 [Photorhabdus aegyptia]KTL61250.1 hypothetical protein AA106_09870 [Photorhabdus laumondii subsp. laumondii]
MVIKNIQISSKKGQGKPLVICEFDEQGVLSATGNFHLNESEMKKVADKMAELLIKKKGN